MKRFVALTVVGALTLASLAGCQKASTAEKQPAGGETTESQAENGGNEKKSTDAKLLKTSMPTAWDETHGYTQALIAMNAYLDEASGGRLQLDIYAGGQLGPSFLPLSHRRLQHRRCTRCRRTGKFLKGSLSRNSSYR